MRYELSGENVYCDEVKFSDQFIQFYASERGIFSISLSSKSFKKSFKKTRINKYTTSLKKELIEYLDGKKKIFKTRLDLSGTEFQEKVWRELMLIPYGKVQTYKDIALRVGGANYSRAVGMANNKNKLPIVIPCHRVIGSNRNLVGYALGLEIKKRLLEIEGIKIE